MRDGTKGKATAKPKKTLTWTERLAQLPEAEAAALRAKAAEASRRSKARKRGMTPEQAAVARLEARLARGDEKQAALNAERQAIGEQLEAAQAAAKEAGDAQ